MIITAPTLRLDLDEDRECLAHTVAAFEPRLLILDPFVRLHRIDENASSEVAPILAYLRELQRRHELAVLLVHHAKKSAARVRAGQALCGSSEFHAWGDSNLYLRRTPAGALTLTIEHRAAASLPPLALELSAHGAALALTLLEKPAAPVTVTNTLEERSIHMLHEAAHPMPLAQLRKLCRVRNATLHERLRAMTTAGLILRGATGYHLAVPPS